MSKLLLVTNDYPPRHGGVARYYSGLVQELGNEAAVLTNVSGAAGPGIVCRSLTWRLWPHWLPLLWRVPLVIRQSKAELVAAGELLPTGTALWLLHRLKGQKYWVFLHGFDVGLAGRTWWKRWLTRHILSSAHRVITNSSFSRGLAIAGGAIEERTVVVRPALPPLPPPADSGVLRQRYSLGTAQILLSVARLVRRKGIDDVMAVLTELCQTNPGIKYVVVGDGPERGNLEKLASTLKLPVVFVGTVDDVELATWYELCDVFVLTPKQDKVDVEGFGIVYLEAQSMGKPVIASSVGGVPEAVGNGGILVSNAMELLAALRKLLTEAETRIRLGNLGRNQIREFTTTRQAAIIREHLYAD